MISAIPDTELALRILKIVLDLYGRKHDVQAPKVFTYLRDTEGCDSSLELYMRMASAFARLIKTGLLSSVLSTFDGKPVKTYIPGPKIAKQVKHHADLTNFPRRKIDIQRLLNLAEPSYN
jgi:hypothetical protein